MTGGFLISLENHANSEWNILWGGGASYVVDGETMVHYENLPKLNTKILLTLYGDEYGIWGAVHMIRKSDGCIPVLQTLIMPRDMHEDISVSYEDYYSINDDGSIKFNLINDDISHYVLRYSAAADSLILSTE